MILGALASGFGSGSSILIGQMLTKEITQIPKNGSIFSSEIVAD